MPALLPAIRNARRHAIAAIALRRRIDPDADDDAEQCGDGSETGRPGDETAPGDLVLPERREVDPVRDRAEIGANARGGRGVLDDLAGRLRHIDLLTIRPRIPGQRSRGQKRSLHRPLIRIIERLDGRRSRRLLRPRRRRARDQVRRHVRLLRAGVGVDETLAAAGAESIDRAAVERVEPHLRGRLRLAQCRVGLGRRHMNRRGIERRRPVEAITGGDAGEIPVHHADARGEPEQEQQAQRDAEPTVEEYRGSLDHDRKAPVSGRPRARSRSGRTAAAPDPSRSADARDRKSVV